MGKESSDREVAEEANRQQRARDREIAKRSEDERRTVRSDQREDLGVGDRDRSGRWRCQRREKLADRAGKVGKIAIGSERSLRRPQ